MKRLKQLRLLVVPMLFSFAWLFGCADVPSTGPDTPVFNSEFRFVNGDPGLGSVGVSVDGASAGTIGYTETTGYKTYPSGKKSVSVGSDIVSLDLTSEVRGTVLFLPKENGERVAFRLSERHTYDPANVGSVGIEMAVIDTASGQHVADSVYTTAGTKFRLVNAAIDTVVDVHIIGEDIDLGDGTVLENWFAEGGFEYKKKTDYFEIPAGEFTVYVVNSGTFDVLAQTLVNLGDKRNTSFFVGSATTGYEIVNLQDN